LKWLLNHWGPFSHLFSKLTIGTGDSAPPHEPYDPNLGVKDSQYYVFKKPDLTYALNRHTSRNSFNQKTMTALQKLVRKYNEPVMWCKSALKYVPFDSAAKGMTFVRPNIPS
jgi:hypothetical protein